MIHHIEFWGDPSAHGMTKLRYFFAEQILRNADSMRFCRKEGCEHCTGLLKDNADFETTLSVLGKEEVIHGFQLRLKELN